MRSRNAAGRTAAGGAAATFMLLATSRKMLRGINGRAKRTGVHHEISGRSSQGSTQAAGTWKNSSRASRAQIEGGER